MSNRLASILVISSFIESMLKMGLGFLLTPPPPWMGELLAEDLLPTLGFVYELCTADVYCFYLESRELNLACMPWPTIMGVFLKSTE
jgi:hypothetical protein